jgi:ATPase subunit of ABC transporter with duplicated ATPase domains
VSDNVSTMGSIGINIPEFRTTLVIEELELPVTECVSDRVLVLPRIMSIFNLEEIEAAEVDKENDSNGVNVSATVQNNGTPEKIKHTCSNVNNTSEKKKFRSPLKSGCTPNKKKDRSAGGLRERDSPPQMSQIFSFMTAPSHRNSSSASGSTNQGHSRNGFGRESISPGDVNLTETQLAVLERCKQGENVFLTGGAGTGKSHLLKCILQEMVILHGKQAVSVTATTGIAAVSVGGTTVHQFAGIRPGDTVTEVGDSFKQVHYRQKLHYTVSD